MSETKSADKTERAYCWASGLIEFGPRMPAGALPIASGPSATLREVIGIQARYSYDGVSLIVPGVPEAETPNDAVDALIAWRDRVAGRLAERMVAPAIAKAEGRS